MSGTARRHAKALHVALAILACAASMPVFAGKPAALVPGADLELALRTGARLEFGFADCGADPLAIDVQELGIDVHVELAPPTASTLSTDDLAFPRHGVHRLAATIDDCAAARLRVTAGDGAQPPGRIRIHVARLAADDANARARRILSLRDTAALQLRGADAALVPWAWLATAWSALDDAQRAGEDWFRAANQSVRAGDRVVAGAYFAAAAAAGERAGDLRLAVWARNDGAMNEWRRGEGVRAAALLRDLVPASKHLDDLQLQSTVLNNYCLTDRLNSDLEQARACYEEALGLSRQSADRQRIANALNNLGGARMMLGDTREAKALFEEAYALKRQIGDKPGEALTVFNLGFVAHSQGRLGDALDGYTRARAMYVELGDRTGEARTLAQMGDLQAILGMKSAARETNRQALALVEKTHGEIEIYILLALSRLTDSAAQRSELVERAAQRADAFGSLDSRHSALLARLRDRLALGQIDEAERLLRQAGKDITAANASWRMDIALIDARIAIRKGNTAAAAERLAAARADAAQQPDALRLSEILLQSGELAFSQQAYAQADEFLARADATLEPIRARIGDAATRARFAADHDDVYRMRLDALMQRHRHEPGGGFDRQALLLADAERARSLREAIGDAAPADAAVDAESMQANALALAAARAAAEGDTRTANEARLKMAAIEGRRALAALKLDTDALARHERDAFTPAAELDAFQKGLDGDAAMIAFAFGREQVYAWRIGARGVSSYAIGTPEDIRRAAAAASAEVRGDAGNDGTGTAAAALARRLFGAMPPIAERVLLAPDDALLDVPFPALPLPDDGTALLERAEIEMAPSLLLIARLGERTPARGEPHMLVVADPVLRADDERLQPAADAATKPLAAARTGIEARLYASADEAETVSSLAAAHMATTRLEGFDATRERVLAAFAAKPAIIHFATHALTDSEALDSNGVVLSQFAADRAPLDGYLGLRDIAGAHLAHGLVVLSACSTGRGANLGVEGTWGLVQAFMLGGSNQVVATLWDVSDNATSQLMRAFYHGLFVDKLAPPAALRAAQRELRSTRRFRAPHYWAGFFVSGVGQTRPSPHP